MDRELLERVHFDSDKHCKREVVLRELGCEEQEKPRRSTVAVIGLGVLGSGFC